MNAELMEGLRLAGVGMGLVFATLIALMVILFALGKMFPGEEVEQDTTADAPAPPQTNRSSRPRRSRTPRRSRKLKRRPQPPRPRRRRILRPPPRLLRRIRAYRASGSPRLPCRCTWQWSRRRRSAPPTRRLPRTRSHGLGRSRRSR